MRAPKFYARKVPHAEDHVTDDGDRVLWQLLLGKVGRVAVAPEEIPK